MLVSFQALRLAVFAQSLGTVSAVCGPLCFLTSGCSEECWFRRIAAPHCLIPGPCLPPAPRYYSFDDEEASRRDTFEAVSPVDPRDRDSSFFPGYGNFPVSPDSRRSGEPRVQSDEDWAEAAVDTFSASKKVHLRSALPSLLLSSQELKRLAPLSECYICLDVPGANKGSSFASEAHPTRLDFLELEQKLAARPGAVVRTGCGHDFCFDCLKKVRGEILQCPTCRREIRAPQDEAHEVAEETDRPRIHSPLNRPRGFLATRTEMSDILCGAEQIECLSL